MLCNELCALNKLMGRGRRCTASTGAAFLHQHPSAAMSELEERVKVERGVQLDVMQRHDQRVLRRQGQEQQGQGRESSVVTGLVSGSALRCIRRFGSVSEPSIVGTTATHLVGRECCAGVGTLGGGESTTALAV